jgi:hypothetical protein
MRKVRSENSEFDWFLLWNEKCENGMRIDDYTILPVQRVPRYLLLLKGTTAPSTQHSTTATGAFD